MRITVSRLRQLIREAISDEGLRSAGLALANAMPGSVDWGPYGNPYGNERGDLTEFQESVNEFLDSAGYEPAVAFWWDPNDEEGETLILSPNLSEGDRQRVEMYIEMSLDDGGALSRFGRSQEGSPHGGRRAAFTGDKINFGQD